MEPLNYVLLGVLAVIITVGFVITIRRNNAIRKNGIEADAVISRIEEHESTDSDGMITTSYTYYVQFRTNEGSNVEAKLGKILQKNYRVGDQLRIMYLPEKPNYAVPAKITK
ncbi:MAG: DUF3592 domain-containing protein [Clostridia bacterium]|nr:DUF3592 domain-containing protein [Clostridia bacterium]